MTQTAAAEVPTMGTETLHEATQAALANLPTDVDPSPLTGLFFAFKQSVGEMANQAQAHEVVDGASSAKATEMVSQLKTLSTAIEKRRKLIVAPYNQITKAVNAPCKDLQGTIKRTIGFLERRQGKYLKAEEDKRIAAAEAMQPDPEEGQGAEVVHLEVAAPKTETELGRTRLKTVKEWAITDPSKACAAAWNSRFKQITDAIAPWVNQAIKDGAEEIPGVEVVEVAVAKTSVRR